MPNQRAPGVRMRCFPAHDDLYDLFKATAAERGDDMAAVIRAALEEYVKGKR